VTVATLHPCRIKIMLMATWELLSNPSAEDLLRAMLIESTGPALDRALFSQLAATAERPAGLLFGIAPLASTGNLTNDLMKFVELRPFADLDVAAPADDPYRTLE
jgi:hypothetical protein